MRYKLEDAPEEPVTRDKCRHYWIIESPKGPTSRGVCKLCGAEREFRNSFPYSIGEGNVSFLFGTDRTRDIKIDAEEVDDF